MKGQRSAEACILSARGFASHRGKRGWGEYTTVYWYNTSRRIIVMSRAFNGQIHVRVPASLHEEVAKEAFDKGTSISGILAQALVVRRALRNVDPWKSIEEVQSANRGVPAAEVENTVAKAVRAVRKARRGPDVKKARI